VVQREDGDFGAAGELLDDLGGLLAGPLQAGTPSGVCSHGGASVEEDDQRSGGGSMELREAGENGAGHAEREQQGQGDA
jgi:hypothetical protein